MSNTVVMPPVNSAEIVKPTAAHSWAARSQTSPKCQSELNGTERRELSELKELVAPERVAKHNDASCFEERQSLGFGNPRIKYQVQAVVRNSLR